MKKKKSIFKILFLMFFSFVFVFSIYKIYHLLNDHATNQKEVESIQDEIILNKEVVQKIEDNKEEESNPSYTLELDFPKLKEMNTDTVGWIEIRNTHINYPIVQTDNNDYYLNHSFYKNDNGDGWIFLSYINHLFEDNNTVVFGHDTHGVSMFSDLKSLYNGSLGNSIPITIYQENAIHQYETFAILLTEENDNRFLKNRLYERDVQSALEESNIDFGIDASVEDTILTLSTCYNNSSHKVILLAKRV